MKKIIFPVLLSTLALSSCDVLNDVASAVLEPTTGTTTPSLTNGEVISGLKEALKIGITNSVDLTSAVNGFMGNSNIKLPFPPDAIKVKEKALEWGLDNQVNQFEETLNRAAESAAKEALPIFVDAITNMSVNDGFAILKGGSGAATNFFERRYFWSIVHGIFTESSGGNIRS